MCDWCEILIHDDCSTDGTDNIIREYASNYPDLIFPLYEDVNQFSQGKENVIDMYNYGRARGKYIAYCEGDDYWTDPLKLQKQVDFMESHPEFSVCWHRCRQWFVESDTFVEDRCSAIIPTGKEGVEIDLNTYFSQWYTQPLTMLFRLSVYNAHWRDQYRYYRDEHELYHLLKQGKGYLFAFIGGVYVKHSGGIYSSMTSCSQGETSLNVARELYEVNQDEYTRRFYSTNLQWQIYENTHCIRKKWQYSWELYRVEKSYRRLIKNILRK